jgi:hypothetical protein
LQRVGQWRAGNPYHALEREVQFRRHADRVRIPTKPATHSNLKPATYSDAKPAGIPI